jgi:site-specific recombinase XerD
MWKMARFEATQNDLAGLKEIIGHSNLSNLGIYTHPTLKRSRDNLEKMKINRNRQNNDG